MKVKVGKRRLIDAAKFKNPHDKAEAIKIMKQPEIEAKQKEQVERKALNEKREKNVKKVLEQFNEKDKEIRAQERIVEIYNKSMKVLAA